MICWAEYEVVRIEKVEKIYLSTVDKQGYLNAIQFGMPGFLLSGIKVLNYELPKLIQNRIKGYKTLNEAKIISYIKQTECRYNTDKFSVKVLE